MENASKALVMAGGVLIAIMILATLVYASLSWGIFPSAKDKSDAASQLDKFNQEYESYHKDLMYGTDMVSILNKAIDYNKGLAPEDEENLKITISVKMHSDVQKVTKEYKAYMTGDNAGKTVQIGNPKYESKGTLRDGFTYNTDDATLINFLTGFMNNTGQVKLKEAYKSDETGKYQLVTVTIVENSEFKMKMFKCTGTDYREDGRIRSMSFEEYIHQPQ